VAVKLDLIPFGRIMPPPDLILALRKPLVISALLRRNIGGDRALVDNALGIAKGGSPRWCWVGGEQRGGGPG
jgi:hypothetical protein